MTETWLNRSTINSTPLPRAIARTIVDGFPSCDDKSFVGCALTDYKLLELVPQGLEIVQALKRVRRGR